MTSSVETFPLFGGINSEFPIDTHGILHEKHHCRHALKSKAISYRHRCNKVLRRKLKKYKLRQDGREDQDVLDVSKILVSSLIIKSPTGRDPLNFESEICELDELRPKNYLFKMVKRRNGSKITEYLGTPKVEEEVKDDQNYTSTPTVSQEKTNAFKLLMDSRNKSIGSNLSGKEKSDNESEDEEFLEKKKVKVKRQVLLQKMAEAKGSLKKKKMEEYHEKCIKKKMEKRVEKLKSMILNDKKVVISNGTGIKLKEANILVSTSINDKKSDDVIKNKKKTLQIVDIFNAIEETVKVIPENKIICEEDAEFLQKLSPSLKKKESMLSYFQKLDKEPESPLIDTENHSPIKVKFNKIKKRGRKKLCLNKISIDDCDVTQGNEKNYKDVKLDIPSSLNVNHESIKDNNDRPKVKTLKVEISEVIPATNSEDRPRRSVKRPIKYTDDGYLSSSDEGLNIFTPKKKKHTEDITEEKPTKLKSKKISSDSIKSKDKKVVKGKVESKQAVKLAPIFSKPSQTDPAALEAKQKFLQSGVPEKLKKIINQQKINNVLAINFPVVVHVQQNDVTNIIANMKYCNIPIKDVFTEEDGNIYYTENALKEMLNLCKEDNTIRLDFTCKPSVQALLQNLKELHPKFPVYRTYRYLKGKRKGEYKDFNYTDLDNSIEILDGTLDLTNDTPETLNWTNKYRAMTANQIIGNFESIKELRKWLVSWAEDESRSKTKSTLDSDSSDYYQSDTDSKDSAKSMNNLIILTGPTGSGKTSCVYAVAAELAMKVIEVNVSSKRTGKIMLQELQEATQSHKVNRGTGVSDNSQKSQEKTQSDSKGLVKKRGRPKKQNEKKIKKPTATRSDLSGTPSSQESVRTGMSLILIDDADIVFEQDDGFSSAIVQLVQSSKRPVILVTSSLVCPHLQRFMQYGKILRMYPLLPRILGTWLDIVCLADTNMCWPGLGAKFLNYFKGDIRKTINYLQFYTTAYVTNLDEEASQNVDNFKVNIDDENSSTSWADHDNGMKYTGENNNIDTDTSMIWDEFSDKHSNLLIYKHPVDIFNIWWSVPHLLDLGSAYGHNIESLTSKSIQNNVENTRRLEAIASAVDTLSMADFFCLGVGGDITSDPWYTPATDSVSELENLDLYYRSKDLTGEISHELVTGSIVRAQSVSCCNKRTNLDFPDMKLQRQKDKIVSRHTYLTSYLSSWSVLDRRAVALDYWPACRSICRTEKDKTDNNSKRNNRFCHYLKSLSVLCKSDTFDKIGDSLCYSVWCGKPAAPVHPQCIAARLPHRTLSTKTSERTCAVRQTPRCGTAAVRHKTSKLKEP